MSLYGLVSPYLFMVACGVGLYFPYVAFQTTVFERLIAIARMPAAVLPLVLAVARGSLSRLLDCSHALIPKEVSHTGVSRR